MANPFRQMFPDSKCVNTIQTNVPTEVYKRMAEEARIQNTSLSEIMLLSLKAFLYDNQNKT